MESKITVAGSASDSHVDKLVERRIRLMAEAPLVLDIICCCSLIVLTSLLQLPVCPSAPLWLLYPVLTSIRDSENESSDPPLPRRMRGRSDAAPWLHSPRPSRSPSSCRVVGTRDVASEERPIPWSKDPDAASKLRPTSPPPSSHTS